MKKKIPSIFQNLKTSWLLSLDFVGGIEITVDALEASMRLLSNLAAFLFLFSYICWQNRRLFNAFKDFEFSWGDGDRSWSDTESWKLLMQRMQTDCQPYFETMKNNASFLILQSLVQLVELTHQEIATHCYDRSVGSSCYSCRFHPVLRLYHHALRLECLVWRLCQSHFAWCFSYSRASPNTWKSRRSLKDNTTKMYN